MTRFSLTWFLLAALAACGSKPPKAAPPAPPPSAELQKLVLAADPGTAVGVLDAKLAGPADKVVLVGRIAKVTRPAAQFTLMDTEVPYCGETNKEDKCKTPWDYCCESSTTRTANSLVVEVRGADGKVANGTLPDLREVDKVKVTGKLTKDEFGNYVLVATGLFRVERPTLPEYVVWPQ
jgi:hypothetical protein